MLLRSFLCRFNTFVLLYFANLAYWEKCIRRLEFREEWWWIYLCRSKFTFCIVLKWFILLHVSLYPLDFKLMVNVFAPNWRSHVKYAVYKKKKKCITLKCILNLLVRAHSLLLICIEHSEAKKHTIPCS